MTVGQAGGSQAGASRQALRLAFYGLYGIAILAAFGWTTSNIRQINPDSQAVVLRMGAFNRVESAGLLLALPQPFEQVVLLPSADRVVERHITTLLRPEAGLALTTDALAGSGYLLTGDAGVVHLDVRVFFKVTDPYSFVLQRDHLESAFDRLVERNAVVICASRDLDTILVARPELVGNSARFAEQRERLRSDLTSGINQALDDLRVAGAGLGIRAERVDVQSTLPAGAIEAFNSVLTASQRTEQVVAKARNDAAKQTQAATQGADRTIQLAYAQASERLAKARSDTALIASLTSAAQANTDPGLLTRVYRERIRGIFSKAGSIITVDPGADSRLILDGAEP